MYATPAGFQAALSKSHSVTTQVDVLVAGQTVKRITSTSSEGVLSGQVTVDSTAQVRRSLQLSIADPTGNLYPERIGDLLAPPNEVKVWQGVGGFPLLPLGVFGISEPDLQDQGGVTLNLKAFDRAAKISRRKWTSVFTLASGTSVPTAIQSILTDRDPTGSPLNAALTTATLATTVVLGADNGQNDPWVDIQTLAAAAGMTCFYDPDGVPVLRPLPDPTSDPIVATYAEGEGGLYLGGTRGFSDQPGTNGIIIIGNGAELAAPYRVAVWDTNPSSPTYYDPAKPAASTWGPVPDIQTTDLIPDAATATTVATAQLKARLGTAENVTFNGVPNPAHDAGDTVLVQRAALSVNARYLLESFTLTLGPGPMQAKCRSRQVL